VAATAWQPVSALDHAPLSPFATTCYRIDNFAAHAQATVAAAAIAAVAAACCQLSVGHVCQGLCKLQQP